jgi:hypothetical protein
VLHMLLPVPEGHMSRADQRASCKDAMACALARVHMWGAEVHCSRSNAALPLVPMS